MNIASSPSVSGMQTSILRQEISSHDIANINTTGYGQYTPYQTETSPAGTRISHVEREANSGEGLSNTDLATEAVEQKESVATLKANSAVIKVQDRMMGALLDIFA